MLNPIGPGQSLGVWVGEREREREGGGGGGGGGERKVLAAYNSKTNHGLEMEFGRVVENQNKFCVSLRNVANRN